MSLKNNKKDYQIYCLNKKFNGEYFYIDSSYNVQGIGVVVTGINRGTPYCCWITKLCILDHLERFQKNRIKSLHNNFREVVPFLENHHRGCINFAPVEKGEIKENILKRNGQWYLH